ncbi:hypothetical protein GCM10010195_23210 [Kitasatospora griseola]|nr:hypothetical protein GCM10010195_23210 [Kitasatospora griseola]
MGTGAGDAGAGIGLPGDAGGGPAALSGDADPLGAGAGHARAHIGLPCDAGGGSAALSGDADPLGAGAEDARAGARSPEDAGLVVAADSDDAGAPVAEAFHADAPGGFVDADDSRRACVCGVGHRLFAGTDHARAGVGVGPDAVCQIFLAGVEGTAYSGP